MESPLSIPYSPRSVDASLEEDTPAAQVIESVEQHYLAHQLESRLRGLIDTFGLPSSQDCDLNPRPNPRLHYDWKARLTPTPSPSPSPNPTLPPPRVETANQMVWTLC